MKKTTALLGLAALILTGCKKDDGPEFILRTLTFENVPSAALAAPNAHGDNLYSSYDGVPFTTYTDPATGLGWEITESYGSREFWNGGIAASRWNDRTTADLSNQCSVYATGGHGGSKTFAVVYYSTWLGPDFAPAIGFGSDEERVVDHLWLCNATYAVLTMRDGNDFAKKFSYDDRDWLRVILTGLDAEGNETGKVEFHLADFRTPSSGGIVEGWHKVDLASLGRVNKIAFSFDSSDIDPVEGMNTPGYVCIDDVAVRK